MSDPQTSCPECGMSFNHEKPWSDENILRHLYYDEKLSLRETSEVFGINDSSLLYWMDKHGIDRRTVSEAHGLNPLEMSTSSTGYERFSVGTSENSARTVFVHRLLAVAENGLDAIKGKEVHHKNGVPWDNRPGNIQLMKPKDHRKLHWLEVSDKLAKASREKSSKLTKQEVREIKRKLKTDVTQKKIAQEYGMSENAISKIKLGEYWEDVEA